MFFLWFALWGILIAAVVGNDPIPEPSFGE
jgi:hypothetical protein